MKRLMLLVACTACSGTPQMQNQVMTNTAAPDAQLTRLTQMLAEARKQSESYLSGEALPARKDIVAIVDADARPWWQSLTPDQTFLLFEASPPTAARAPADVRVTAYCAGVENISAEWWGTPGAPQTELSRRVIALGKPVARCLARLFDSDRRIFYKDGETRVEAKQNQWTVADLAAGLAARAVGESYEASAAPAERAARRQALRPKLQ
jgi:predicted transcriptional regulator